jgi:hypothetical protein
MAKSRKKPSTIFIKTSFEQVTAQELLAIESHSPIDILCSLSGFDREYLEDLGSDQIIQLYSLVSYIDNIEEAYLYLPSTFEPVSVDVGADTFERAEVAKNIINSNRTQPYKASILIAETYLGSEVLTKPVPELLTIGAIIIQSLAELFERFKDLASGGDPTDEEIEAGIESLHSFGTYGICENIASKYKCKPFEVYQWEAEAVYLELTYQLAKNKYQENIREIERRKSQRNS